MTDDPYERYLDDFGRELERAAARTAPKPVRRRRLRLAVATAATAAIAATITTVSLLAPSGDQRLDVLAEARAALAPRGDILHTVVRTSVTLPKGHPDWMRSWSGGQQIEQWSTTSPRRWRTRISPVGGGGTYVAGSAALTGAFQTAYANGRETSYAESRGRVVIRPIPPAHAAGRVPGQLPGGRPDPVAAVRAFLARGALHDRGTATVDGRRLRRLSGTVRVAGGVLLRLECFVDPTTFVPALARVQRVGAAMRRTRRWTPISVVRFVRVERLPLTPANERLLRIEPPSGAAVLRAPITEALEVAREQLRRLAAGRTRQRRAGP